MTGQVLVTLTQQEDGSLKCRFECVGTDAVWAVEMLAGLVYGDGDTVEEVKFR